MKLYYKALFSLLFLFLLFFASPLKAQNENVTIYLFYGDGCPHCAQEKEFIYQELKPDYPNLEIKEYEIYKNRKNAIFLQKVARILNARVDGVPFSVIG
ncbi:MAG: hypothetical protein WCZ15_03470, partial [Patescibacteria group bacterium]